MYRIFNSVSAQGAAETGRTAGPVGRSDLVGAVRESGESIVVSQSSVLVVVPAFNEVANVGSVVEELRLAGFAVLVVDDGSSDGTADRAREEGASVVRLPINLGVGGALRCGFRYAVENGYNVVVQCDGDGQHIASQIQVLLNPLAEKGAHLVVGSRFRTDNFAVSHHRKWIMRLLCIVASRRAGVALTDTTSGFRAIREPLLSAFAARYPTQYLGDTFEALVSAASSGYVVAEVPVLMRPRLSGKSSATTLASIRYVIRALLMVGLGTRMRLSECEEVGADSSSLRKPKKLAVAK